MVKNNEIMIVDEFTGRLMPGRRWSEGAPSGYRSQRGSKNQKRKSNFSYHYISKLLSPVQ